MRTLFYLSESQMERISPFFPRSHGIPRADDRHVVSGILYVTNMDFVEGCSRRNMVRTRRCTTVRQVEQARCFQQDLHRVGKPDAL